MMQNSKSDPIPHGCIFVSNRLTKQSMTNWDSTVSDETASSPFMLDAINDIDRLLLVNGNRMMRNLFSWAKKLIGRGVSNTKKIEAKYWIDMPFNDIQLPEERGDARMIRVSSCKYFVATVFKSSIIIEKSEIVLEQKPFDESSIEAEFNIKEGKYTYLEWPHLNHDYIERPYFLTLDDQGKIRIHYVKEKTEKIVTKEEEFYQCATFSLDGRSIYAINEKQEICKISFESSRIIMKRKIDRLSDSEGIILSHIQQVTPSTFAIGSVEKIEVETEVIERNKRRRDEEYKVDEPEKAKFKSCLHLVSGDISDVEKELKIKTFEIPLLQSNPNRAIIFRSLYIKERGLLLFGHSNSPKIITLSFGFDGSITENAGISLLFTTMRGIVLMSEERSASGQKNENEVDYHRKKFKLPKPPKILILDAKGLVHVFHYYDTRYVTPQLSMYIRPLSIQEFGQKQKILKQRFNPMNKNRSKSQLQKSEKILTLMQEKCRSKSQVKSKNCCLENRIRFGKEQTKIDPPEHKKTPIVESSPLQKIQVDKVEYPFSAEGIVSSSLISPTPLTAFNKTDNPFLSVKTGEIRSITKKANQATNSLFSSSKDSLFSQNTKPSFAFQKPKDKPRYEANDNLFSSAPKFDFSSQVSGLGSRNLFSSNASLKLFTTKEGLEKKNASLFLDKASSDVLFKVESEEFPAHKSVLSEKCKFFKQMFASGMLESYSSVIKIPDTKASMFRAFLEYIYLGQTVLNEEICLTLIDLAEKYIIEDLKAACEGCLSFHLTVDNCMKLYDTACLYDAPHLKQKTMLFIEMSIKKILEKYNFQDLPLSGLSVLANHYKNNPILGPSISQLIVKTEDPRPYSRIWRY